MTHVATAHHSSPAAAMAFLAGIGAGAIAALLFAPRSGEQTRAEIKSKALETKQKLQDRMADKKEQIVDKIEEVTDTADRLKAEGKDMAQEAKTRTRRSMPDANP
jgi:gas vesicle protein